LPNHALIDLDGTLTDPAPGIIGSVRHALGRLGLPVPPVADLGWVIGPPLRQTFPRLGVPPERVEEALGHYRQEYGNGAMFDAMVYPGMPEALAALTGAGIRLVVATSKPHVYARPILAHFGLIDHFAAIYGAELDGRNDDKGDLIAAIIAGEGIEPRRAAMVGDRLFDIRAARRHGIAAVGVLWGYGGRAELTEAGADVICASPSELPATVLARFGSVMPKSRR
jgi:phosphoglycolate phosphatase